MSRSLSQTYRIGELDERIELQRETFVEDDIGGQTSEWVTQATVWAHVRPLRGNERLHSDMLMAHGGYRVVIRNRSDLDIRANWRVVWRGRAMNIRFPEYSGPRDLYLVLECEAGVAT